MDKSQKELEELIDRYLTDMATKAEVAKLDELLKTDEQLRQTFLAASRLDSHLREQAEQTEMEIEEHSSPHKIQSAWITPAAAAGLLIGLFSASIVWAYAISRDGEINRTSREIVSESFEDPGMKPSSRFPFKANEWFGQMLSVLPEGTVPSAVEGSRVGKLQLVPGKTFGFARYIIDLSDYPKQPLSTERSIEVRASFAVPAPENVLYRVGLAAFRQTPRAVQSVWNDQENFEEEVLQEVSRNHSPGKKAGWHEVKAAIQAPPGSQSIVISLGARHIESGKSLTNFYLDAIQIQLIDTIEQSSD